MQNTNENSVRFVATLHPIGETADMDKVFGGNSPEDVAEKLVAELVEEEWELLFADFSFGWVCFDPASDWEATNRAFDAALRLRGFA